jgi:hypothetical protein
MAVQYANGKIVTDGLILALNAADKNSYPGSGTTWNDLSGNGNNGTLVASPTYSSANGGSIVFNGTSQYVNAGNATNLQITVGTISSWFNANNGNSSFNGIITKQFAWGLFVADNVLVAFDWGNSATRSTGITVGNSTWNYVAMTFTETIGTPSNNAIIYLNGIPVLTTTVKHSGQSVQVQIGEGNSSQFFGGNIAQSSIYNRVLTPQEVAQNYNAQKSRFNLI